MAGEAVKSPGSADEAWRLLVGSWKCSVGTGNSKSVSTFQFTPDRKMIRMSSLGGGVLPFPITNERTTDVTAVSVEGDRILLALGPTPFGRPGGVMTVRLLAPDQLLIEDGPVHTRHKGE